ncbi:MAG: helix-turn-helix transcriptional regulator [Chitinophagaceae bacterium]|nr:helix-turn-helix transcriptional regulator [Chitinophagaceae bacterium]
MVCGRCVMVVAQIFSQEGVHLTSIKLGEVEITGDLPSEKATILSQRLKEVGFEILSDEKTKMVEKIKNIVVQSIHEEEVAEKGNFSDMLSRSIHKDYSYLSKLFSEMEGITIEKYIIQQKIEKVKELLVYGEQNLSEIAYAMGYSSVAHLSAQFKKTTGFNPTTFRKLKDHRRRSLDSI